MSQHNRQITGTAIVTAAAGVGLCLVVTKYRTLILSKLKCLINYDDPLRNQKIHVIDTVDECRKLMRTLKSHCEEFNVLGFDCEWVIVGGVRRPVALLQLASHRGLCALIRLSHLQMVPSELKEILADDNIVKVGVAPQGDVKYLVQDYGVCVASALDLRYMAAMTGCRPGGLGKMSQDYLNVKLDKDWRIRCSDWEIPTLNRKQIDYAAKDAHVAIELFKLFAEKLQPKKMLEKQTDYVRNIIDDYCFQYHDLPYNGVQTVEKPNTKLTTAKNPNESNRLKKPTFPARQKPLYENCYMETKDGELLCTIDRKKAMWYVNKEIGEVVKSDPLTVRLKFEPAGRAVGQTGEYYKQVKENKCVVCGKSDQFNRKNVVPREYRKYFPYVMKDHTSHDIVLLCTKCHQISNMHDSNLRETLAKECDAPLTSKNVNMKTFDIPHLKEIKSCARALYYHQDKIPEDRRSHLFNRLKKLCPDEDVMAEDFLKTHIDIDISEDNENYCTHGSKVVEFYQNSEQGLISLERRWRTHFLNTMKPKYLPSLWSIEHNAERLTIRANEGRIDEHDMKLAGLTIAIAMNQK